MVWLGMALVTEGGSDDRFLPGVLERSAIDVCLRDHDMQVVVSRPQVFRVSSGPGNRDRLIGELLDNVSGFNLLLVHHDGARAHEWLDPFLVRWAGTGRPEPAVPVVPVRETEAWALADLAALARLFGTRWTPEQLAVLMVPQTPQAIESDRDPKRTLRRLAEAAGTWTPRYLDRLGDLVDMGCLRRLPAFRRWENDLAEALRMLPGFTKR